MAAEKRQTRVAGESLVFLALIGAILIVANVVATNFNLGRVDLTRNQVYSLSQGSRNVMHDLQDRLTVRVYFTDNLPAEFANTERQVRDLLAEYKAASRGNLVVRYIRPDNEERQEQAERDGVRKVQHTVFRNDAREQVDGYRGMAFEYRGETKAIPIVQGSEGLEYQITMLVRELIGEKHKVGVLTGHGASATTGGLNVLKNYMPSYEFVDVDATQAIPTDVRALLVIGPESPLSEAELRNVDAYVMQGGSLGVFGGSVKMPSGQPTATMETVDSGVNTLLDKWGIHVDDDVVADARCTYRQSPNGPQGMPEPYPVWPVVGFDEAARTHPASYQLNETLLAYASTLSRKTVPSGVRVRILASSSAQSWKLTGSPISVEAPGGDWPSTIHEQLRSYPLIAAIEGRVPSAFASVASTSAASEAPAGPTQARGPVRILVVGSSSLFHEQFVPPPEAMQNPQVAERASAIIAFTLNSVDWLANDGDLIAIRSKTIDAPMLDMLQNIQRTDTAERAALQQEVENLDARDRAGIERVRAQQQRAQDRLEAMQTAFERKKNLYKWGITLALPLLVVVFGLVRWRLRQRMKAGLAR